MYTECTDFIIYIFNSFTMLNNLNNIDENNFHKQLCNHFYFRLQEQFRIEQLKLSEQLEEKDAVIQAQEDRINALDRTNTQLLMALEHIREL